VGYGDAALGHHLDEISIAEPIREVPAHAQFNDFRLESAIPVNRIARNGYGQGAFSQRAGF
jgi:hypothetical protein